MSDGVDQKTRVTSWHPRTDVQQVCSAQVRADQWWPGFTARRRSPHLGAMMGKAGSSPGAIGEAEMAVVLKIKTSKIRGFQQEFSCSEPSVVQRAAASAAKLTVQTV